MLTEENKATAERFVEEVFVRASGETMEGLVTDDFHSHAWAKDFGIPDGPDGVRQFIAIMDSAFSNPGVRVEDVLAEGDKVAVRYVNETDHTGEPMGIGATGKRIHLPGIFIARQDRRVPLPVHQTTAGSASCRQVTTRQFTGTASDTGAGTLSPALLHLIATQHRPPGIALLCGPAETSYLPENHKPRLHL